MCEPNVALILNVFSRSNSTESRSLGSSRKSYICVQDNTVLNKALVDIWVVAYMGNWRCQSLNTTVTLSERGKSFLKTFILCKMQAKNPLSTLHTTPKLTLPCSLGFDGLFYIKSITHHWGLEKLLCNGLLNNSEWRHFGRTFQAISWRRGQFWEMSHLLHPQIGFPFSLKWLHFFNISLVTLYRTLYLFHIKGAFR